MNLLACGNSILANDMVCLAIYPRALQILLNILYKYGRKFVQVQVDIGQRDCKCWKHFCTLTCSKGCHSLI